MQEEETIAEQIDARLWACERQIEDLQEQLDVLKSTCKILLLKVTTDQENKGDVDYDTLHLHV